MWRLALVASGWVLGGCSRIDLNHRAVLPAAGLRGVEATVERGSFTWWGGEEPRIALDVWSYGAGVGLGRAREVEATNDWGVLVDDGLAQFWASSPSPRAGVDLAVTGPRRVDVDAIVVEGSLWVESLRGSLVGTADAITAYDIEGRVDLFAWDTIDATVRPEAGDLLLVETAGGDVRLGLPRGLDYDLEVDAAGGSAIDVDDLGFEELSWAPGAVDAFTFPGTTVVRIRTRGGDVEIYEVAP